ncbi:ABC transporter permease subunit [candidate division FCPU426 bacterium]|nr:ABC transporter permease subunit [candidate division FCPU426 bacterium]
MPQKRPKRLPTDFFDRLLSNQTDDQINDLLTSLVDEQIAPSVEMDEAAPLSAEPQASAGVRRGFHREKIEDAIVTRDEELDEGFSAPDQESALDELIPKTTKMQKSPTGLEAPPGKESPPAGKVKIKFPGAEGLEVPRELLYDEQEGGRQEQYFEVPEVPQPPDVETISRVVGSPPPGVHGAPEQWQAGEVETPDYPLPPDVPQPPEDDERAFTVPVPGDEKLSEPEIMDAAAAFDLTQTEAEWGRPPGEEAPAVSREAQRMAAPSRPLPSHEEMIRARLNARWESPARQPKRPRLAKAVKSITVAPPKPDKISDILGEMDRAERAFKFTKTNRAAMMFLLPAFIAFTLFSWYPMLKGLLISFYNYSPTGVSHFLGFANYTRAFQDTMFWRSLYHGLGFCLLVLALGFWLPIVLSIFINELRWGQRLLKFLFFLPFLMPTVPAAILWKWIMDQGFGLLNSLLAFLPLPDPHIGWLTNPKLALLSLVLVYIWKNTGWAILIYSAALGNIDETMYEEAEIDGASIWDKVRHVTLPMIRGVLAVMLIITIINTIQLFTEVYIMTNGGPMNSTEMIATYIYKQAFFYMDIGYASALSMIMLLMLMVITVLRLRRLDPEGG